MSPLVNIEPQAGTPLLQVLVNGVELSEEVEVSHVSIDREVGCIPGACLRIIDGMPAERNFEHSDSQNFIPGNSIEIKAAYDDLGTAATLFKGIVVKQSIKAMRNGTTCTIVEAKHAVYQLTLGRRSEVYGNKSDKDIVQSLLDKVNVNLKFPNPGKAHEHLVQFNTTDWDFLMTRADASGSLCIVNDDQVVIDDPDLSAESTIELGFGRTLLEFEAALDARTQRSAFEARRWDPSKLDAEVDDQELTIGEPGALSGEDLSGKINAGKEELHYGGITLNNDNLQGLVKARWLRARLAKVRGRAKVVGHESIQPGIVVDLSGMGQHLNGKAFVSGVRHEISCGFWHCQVQFGLNPKFHSERFDISSKPAAGILPAINGLQIGVIKSVDQDTNGLERFEVELPVLGKDLKVFARQASLYTGNERGVFFPPKVDDEVIIGFIDDDPSQAIILGSVFNNADSDPVVKPDSDNNIKGLYLSKDFNIEFDDSDNAKSITLRTPDNRQVILDDKGEKAITLKDDHGNTIKMDQNGITIESGSDLKLKGTNVEIESTSFCASSDLDWEIRGSDGTVNATGGLALRGSKIDLN